MTTTHVETAKVVRRNSDMDGLIRDTSKAYDQFADADAKLKGKTLHLINCIGGIMMVTGTKGGDYDRAMRAVYDHIMNREGCDEKTAKRKISYHVSTAKNAIELELPINDKGHFNYESPTKLREAIVEADAEAVKSGKRQARNKGGRAKTDPVVLVANYLTAGDRETVLAGIVMFCKNEKVTEKLVAMLNRK